MYAMMSPNFLLGTVTEFYQKVDVNWVDVIYGTDLF